MHSIRTYLIVVILAVLCVGNFTAALHGYRTGMLAAEHLLERQLLANHKMLLALWLRNVTPPGDLLPADQLFQILRHGQIVAHSANASTPLAVSLAPGFHPLNYGGESWRVLVHHSARFDLVVGERADLFRDLLEDFTLGSILPIVWAVPLLGGWILVIVWLGLKPLSRLARRLEEREPSDFSALDAGAYPRELSTVVGSINRLFERLAANFARERRFSADAAHELRTPLAALKVGLHNLAIATAARDPDTIRDLNTSADRMAHAIEQLLALYSVSPDNSHTCFAQVDLAALTRRLIAELFPSFTARDQQIELDSDDVTITGYAFGLEMLLRNLLENASKYTPRGGRVRVHLNHSSHHAVLLVEDSGPGIPSGLRSRVFDRFYRAGGDSHASGVKGSGLGLSIVHQVVSLHNASVTLEASAELGGLAVRVLFPVQPINPEPLNR